MYAAVFWSLLHRKWHFRFTWPAPCYILVRNEPKNSAAKTGRSSGWAPPSWRLLETCRGSRLRRSTERAPYPKFVLCECPPLRTRTRTIAFEGLFPPSWGLLCLRICLLGFLNQSSRLLGQFSPYSSKIEIPKFGTFWPVLKRCHS